MKSLALLLFLVNSGLATTPADRSSSTGGADSAARWTADVQTGILWQIGGNTGLDYVLLPQIISIRTPGHLHFGIGEAELTVRARFSLLAEAVAHGPESRYTGFSCGPSLEYSPPSRRVTFFVVAGGGAGWVDSQDVKGAQGQDFTLNWFAEAGLRWQVRPGFAVSASAFFQHLSNGGATDPNPGIDAVGPMLGLTWRF